MHLKGEASSAPRTEYLIREPFIRVSSVWEATRKADTGTEKAGVINEAAGSVSDRGLWLWAVVPEGLAWALHSQPGAPEPHQAAVVDFRLWDLCGDQVRWRCEPPLHCYHRPMLFCAFVCQAFQ
jgi:hypothetical protein